MARRLKKAPRTEAITLTTTLSVLPEDIVRVALGYDPYNVPEYEWERIRDFVLRLLPDIKVKNPLATRTELATLTMFVAWAFRRGVPLDREVIFTASQLESWRQCAYADIQKKRSDWSKRSVADRVSMLRRLGRSINPSGQWTPATAPIKGGITKYSLNAPYSDAEVLALKKAIDTLPNAEKKLLSHALLVFGLGCGPSTAEFRTLRGSDVTSREDVVWITIHGERTREVPVAAPWASEVLRHAKKVGDGLVFPNHRQGRNGFTQAVGALSLGAKAPTLNASRMRTTWMVHRLRAGVDPRVLLLGYAGLTTLNSLQDLARFMPAQDPADALVAMTKAVPEATHVR